MDNYLVVVGASAGGLTALQGLLAPLSKDFPSAIIIVTHQRPQHISKLPVILSSSTQLPISTPYDGQLIKSGNIYVAPPNLHTIVENSCIRLCPGPRVNHSRPAIDTLFSSAAANYRSCTIGIILSGLLDDGSAGLLHIKRNNGIAIVQDLAEAQYSDMPRNALNYAKAKYVLPVKEIANLLIKLTKTPIPKQDCKVSKHNLLSKEINMNKTDYNMDEVDMNQIGKPSVFSCPDCHGVLWEVNDKDILRFRCRVGHAYSLENFSESLDEMTENSLWAALRALEEKASLSKRIMENADQTEIIKKFTEKYKRLQEHINTLRLLLAKNNQDNVDE